MCDRIQGDVFIVVISIKFSARWFVIEFPYWFSSNKFKLLLRNTRPICSLTDWIPSIFTQSLSHSLKSQNIPNLFLHLALSVHLFPLNLWVVSLHNQWNEHLRHSSKNLLWSVLSLNTRFCRQRRSVWKISRISAALKSLTSTCQTKMNC